MNEQALQHKLERWCLASLRALADEPQLDFRGHRLLRKQKTIGLRAPYLHLSFETRKTSELRGVADGIALRLTHCDLDWHHENSPDDPIATLVFDIAEQLRCETLAPDSLPGIRVNLNKRFLFWAVNAASSALVDNDIGLLLYTINVVCWSRLHGQAIPEAIEELIEGTRWGFSDEVKRHLFNLKKHLSNQFSFAEHAKALGNAVAEMVYSRHDNDGDENTNSLNIIEATKRLSLDWLNEDQTALQSQYGIVTGDNTKEIQDGAIDYRVFTRKHDIELPITSAIRQAQLIKLRLDLDKQVQQQAVNTHRLARHIEHLFSSPKRSGWSFGHDEGYLDAARLSRLLTSPNERRLFKRENHQPTSNGAVTILIDNSGSMTRVQSQLAAMVDTLIKALELAKLKTEVLGFTTVDWSGGRALKDWEKAGKPSHPGRLNGIRHTIYKDANQAWRRARPALAGLLRSDLFREGVDGEAIEWAVSRLERRPEQNKILMVISDGSPMETATHAHNDEHYLDRHLSNVAEQIETRPDIKLCALGVGLDLSSYYQRSAFVNLENDLTTKDLIAVANLLAEAT